MRPYPHRLHRAAWRAVLALACVVVAGPFAGIARDPRSGVAGLIAGAAAGLALFTALLLLAWHDDGPAGPPR
jgi:hypothetical protein